MAEVPYNQGVPTEEPQTSVPNDYQDIQSKAGEGLETLGAGLSKAGQFFGQVAADDQTNAVLKGAARIMYGDPSGASTPGPDGQPIPDTGYMGKVGANALNARPDVEKQIDTLIETARGNLSTPEQQLQFDSFTRRYRISLSEQIGSHADQQAKTWYTTVNTDSVNNAQDAVARDPLNPKTVAGSAADTINAMVKQAIVEGADPSNPNDPLIKDALIRGRRMTLNTQVQAIGATDPSAALRILQKNRALAGTDYDNLYASLSDRADQQSGVAAGMASVAAHTAAAIPAAAASFANPAQPVYRQAATDVPGGMSPTGIARTVQIESGGNPNAANASGHVGLGQFSKATWAAYGGGGDPTNPTDSIMAIQRYAAANAQYLTKTLGRPPTDAELYLAHQQGPGGAAKLLANPNALASSIVGVKAVIQNGGRADMTAGEYASMWTHRFNGTTPAGVPGASAAPTAAPGAPTAPQSAPQASAAANGGIPAPTTAPPAPPSPTTALDAVEQPTSSKASAYQDIQRQLDAGTLTPKAAQIAYETINRTLAAQAVAADATAAQAKLKNDQKAKGYLTQIETGGATPDLIAQITHDPDIGWETQNSLVGIAQAHAEDTAAGAPAKYGPGFWSAFNQVNAPPGDPSRISDFSAILRRAAPGGDLTLAGAEKLHTVMGENTSSVDAAAVNTTKASLMAYAKSKISIDTSGMPLAPNQSAVHDAKGEMLFNSRFVPKFEAAYDQWVKAGKNPWEFLTQDNVDKLASGIRSPQEVALARIESQGSGVDPSQLAAPPAPPGVDDEGWRLVVNAPAAYKGAPLTGDKWYRVVERLAARPTPLMIRDFDANFAGDGLTATNVLDILGVEPQEGKSPDQRSSPMPAPEAAPAPAVAAPSPVVAPALVPIGIR